MGSVRVDHEFPPAEAAPPASRSSLRSEPAAHARIHVWFPGVSRSRGGIQAYGASFLRALRSVCSGGRLEVFLKNDEHVPTDEPAPDNVWYRTAKRVRQPRLRTALYVWQILRAATARRPTLIVVGHLHFTPVAYWLRKLLGVPYWIIVYGIETWDVRSEALRRALRRADLVLSISHHTRDRVLAEQALSPERVVVLPCTFDADAFRPGPKPDSLLERYGLAPNQPVILTVSRLAGRERYKGYDRILEALPRIRRSVPDVRYVLVGEGEDRARVESMVREMGLEDCVSLAGFVPDEELCDHYNLCDVFVMPSKREGFGIVYLEALACGKPVIGGNQDGAVDALGGGELGVLLDPDDAAAIADELIRVIGERDDHDLTGSPAELRRRVIERFGFETFQRRLAEVVSNHAPEPILPRGK